jgi:hypothetical protein
MFTKVTPSTGEVLTGRWHDQALDLESLRFNRKNGEATFLVLEESGRAPATKGLMQQRQLQRSCVVIRNVTAVEVSGAEGEVELYVEAVSATPTCFLIRALNGIVNFLGVAMELSIEEDTRGYADTGETEVRLATPIGDISWRKARRKPNS